MFVASLRLRNAAGRGLPTVDGLNMGLPCIVTMSVREAIRRMDLEDDPFENDSSMASLPTRARTIRQARSRDGRDRARAVARRHRDPAGAVVYARIAATGLEA